MKNSIVAGAIAGLVGGVVSLFFGGFLTSLGLISIPPIPTTNLAVIHIILSIIIGAILGSIYSMLYSSIPKKGAMKGLYYGLLIWFIADVLHGLFIALEFEEIVLVTGIAIVGFILMIVYGLVLGYLYKK